MATFFTSDVHFCHANSIKYCNRPFSTVEEMDEALINNWNNIIKPNDTIWSLGDFAFCRIEKIEQILKKLNGKKHFIFGNHCKEMRKHASYLKNEGLLEYFADYKEIKINNIFVVLCHYPMRAWNKSHYGSYMLHGHCHGTLPPFGTSVDVGVDSTFITGKAEYRPFNFDEIHEFMKTRKPLGKNDENTSRD